MERSQVLDQPPKNGIASQNTGASVNDPRFVAGFADAVMNNMSEGLYTVDAEGRITSMNPAAERLFGIKLDDVWGKNFHDVVHYLKPDGSPFPAGECETLRRLVGGETLQNQREVFVRGDGTLFNALLSSSPITINGVAKGTVVVFRDVTEEDRKESELRSSEAKIRIAVEAARQVTWEWNLEQDVIHWNDHLMAVFGDTRLPNPATSREFFDVLHLDDLTGVRQMIESSMRAKSVIDLDFRTKRKDGTFRWISVYGQVTEWKDDRPSRLSGVASDVTERKQAEDDLKRSEQRLLETVAEQKATEEILRQKAALIELSFEPIFVWEPTAGIVEWNTGAEKLYGYTKNEALGRNNHELLRTMHTAGSSDFQKRLEADGFWSDEVRHFTKDGRELVIESNQQIIVSNGRRLVLECNRDISVRKNAERILEKYRMLSENSRDAMWFLTPDSNFVEVNQATVDLYGYSREEFMSMTVRDVRHFTTLGEFEKQFDLADKKGIHFETLHVKKDGTVFPVDVNANGADFGGERLILAIVRDISDRKSSENALRESEERRKLAQEAGRVGLWDWDSASGQTYWSETMWKFYDEESSGINPDHEYWLSHLHPSDRERMNLSIKDALDSKSEFYQNEFRIVGKGGTVRWIETIANIERDETGKALRMYGVNLDVTERKDTEERIRLSENQLRLVTNAVPALISYVDSSERYRFVNQQFNEWFGIPTDELVGRKVRDVFGPQAYRVIKPHISDALAGRPVSFETALTYRSVGTRYVHISYMPDIGLDGTVYGYYGLTNDLTDLKRSQDLLRSSEERMALMVENVTDYAIFSMNDEGVIDNWNTGAEIIFGYSTDEIVGRPCDILFTPEDVARGIPLKEMRTARQKGRASDDRWHLRKDGTRFFASGVMMPLYLGKTLTGYAKIAGDLTEKQRRADELQRAHDELEVRVNERTRELAEANLALVQEMEVREIAERQRIDLLGRLVAGQEVERRRIARDLHDQLGQRVTALRLKIASLKDISVGHDEIAARVQRLQEIGEKLDSEVSFLAWELRPTTLDDLGLVDAARAYVNEWSLHYDIEAEFHSSGLSKGRLQHETETHLYRITQEALNNIIKHADATYVTVLLEKRDNEVLLIVEDNGKGFDTASVTTSGDAEMGLGLIGMRERAALAAGDLEVESAPGNGTTIFVRVPISS